MSTLTPTPSARIARHRRLGALVLLLAVAATLIVATWPDRFGDTRAVRATFDAAESLGPLEVEVRMSGTPVGRVTGRRRVGDDSVLEMALERSAGSLRADATAEIRPRATFEGSAYVELRPGTAREPLGDRPIPRSQTRDYVSIDEALSVLRPPTREAVRTDVDAAAGVLATPGRQGLSEALSVAPRLTRYGATAARAARGPRGDELGRAVRGLATTTSGVAREESRIGPLVEGADRTARALATDGGGALDRTIAPLPERLAAVRGGSRAVRRLAGRIEPLARELRPGAAELAPTLRSLRPALLQARPLLEDAPPLLADLRLTLDAAARAAPSARRLVAASRPTLEILDEAILPALERETRLGLPTYLQLLSAVQGADGALRPFKRRGEEGEGHFMRVELRPAGAGPPVPCGALIEADPALGRALAVAGGCRP